MIRRDSSLLSHIPLRLAAATLFGISCSPASEAPDKGTGGSFTQTGGTSTGMTGGTFSTGGTDLDEFESFFPRIFAYGSSEKLAFTSLANLGKIATIIRKNSQYQWGPNEKEYGMEVKRLHTPAGTLVLTEHPLFGQAGGFLAEDIVVVETSKLVYRYITDTVNLKDREDKGTDGKAEECVDAAHPFRVARGQIIVHGNDVDTAAC